MPLTFPAHQLFVIPLKWAWPRAFDGTALCMGSMAPDLPYALLGTPLSFPSHTLQAQLYWSLPAAVALTLLWRHQIARPLGDWLGGELRALSAARRPLSLTATSALLGAGSHVLVDTFTHPGVLELGVAKALQYTGHVAGSALALLMLASMLRRRLWSEWSGGAVEARPPSPLFRGFALLGLLLALPTALTALYTGGGLPAALMRASWTVAAGLGVGAVVTSRGRR